MQIFFDVIVLLRTNKTLDACGHPIDRVSLDDFISVEIDETKFEATYESFDKWQKEIDFSVNKFLSSIFENKFIIGKTRADANGSSEKHIIRVDDIRNVAAMAVDETIEDSFEEIFNFRP